MPDAVTSIGRWIFFSHFIKEYQSIRCCRNSIGEMYLRGCLLWCGYEGYVKEYADATVIEGELTFYAEIACNSSNYPIMVQGRAKSVEIAEIVDKTIGSVCV